jgi:hypothetical protein
VPGESVVGHGRHSRQRAVAAAEAAVGLGITIAIFRTREAIVNIVVTATRLNYVDVNA